MPKTPSYRTRTGYTQALVTLTDSRTRKRRDYWLGEADTPASRERYHRVIAEWESLGRRLPPPDFDQPGAGAGAVVGHGPGGAGLTVDEIVHRFWPWAKASYRPNHLATFGSAIRLLRQLDGSTPAALYGPNRLRRLREAMIRGDERADPPRQAWSRTYTNNQIQRVRFIFRWAASHELIAPSVAQALATVEPLKRGRTGARETPKVGPAPSHLIEAALPHMSRQVQALVELQLLTGARPGELVIMRAIDIDMNGPDTLWAYAPAEHKNAHREHERIIYLGPKAQEIIAPFLRGRALDVPLFSPAEADAERRAALQAGRRTPLCCGNKPGSNRREQPARAPGVRYTPQSYLRAVWYACDKAWPPPVHLAPQEGETKTLWRARLSDEEKAELAVWRKQHRFHPYQLRHNAATEIRREFGLEAAQLVLGHASATLTDAVYAERDQKKVAEVLRRVG